MLELPCKLSDLKFVKSNAILRSAIRLSMSPDALRGPVMPLSASGDIDNLIADRSIAFDFTNFKSDSLQGSSNISTAVTDTYIITNTSGKDADVQLIYPFTDSFASELADTTAV